MEQRRSNLWYFRLATSALSLAACGLLIALWVRSYWWRDKLNVRLSSTNGTMLTSLEGRLRLIVLPNSFLPVSWTLQTNRPDAPTGWPQAPSSTLGFDIRVTEENNFLVTAPHWFPILLLATLAYVPWIHWRFSLRTLLIAMTLVAVVLGLAVYVLKKG